MTTYPQFIFLIERNVYGAYIVHGEIGRRAYMGYTRREAIRRYGAEVRKARAEQRARLAPA